MSNRLFSIRDNRILMHTVGYLRSGWRYLSVVTGCYETEDVRCCDDELHTYTGTRIIIGPLYIVIARDAGRVS